MSKDTLPSKEKSSFTEKASILVLLVPALVSGIIITLIAMLIFAR